MTKLDKNPIFRCDFCMGTFKDISKLNRHIKTNKKCISSRTEIVFSCIWCNEVFMSSLYLEKHKNKCLVNKEVVYKTLLENYNEVENELDDKDKELQDIKNKLQEKDKQLEDKDKQIKDLQEKLFLIANKPTTTNVNNNNSTTNTYNVTLDCGKPMSFSVDKMVNLLQRTCNINYVLEGETGLGKWVIDHGCRNDEGELCIQITDKNRGIVKYIDENDQIQRLEKEQFIDFFTKTLTKYNTTTEAVEIKKKILDMWEKYHGNQTAMYLQFVSPKNKFFRHIIKETHKGKLEFMNNANENNLQDNS
jgi:hypothetical protein